MSQVIEVKVPDIGDFADVPVIELFVKPGDTLAVDEAICTLESDKATMDVPSPAAGTVREVLVAVGDKVAEGALLLKLEAAGDSAAAAPAAAAAAHPPRHPRRRADGRQRPAHHLAPAVQQQHAIRDRLDQVHVVRAQDHRRAGVAQLADQPAHEVLVHGVEAAEGLIEDRQRRLVQQRGDQLHLLLVPLRQRVDAVALAAREIEALEPRTRPTLRLRLRHPAQTREVDDHRQDLGVGVQAAVLRQVTGAQRVGRTTRAAAEVEAQPSLVGREDAAQHPHDRTLARAVRPEEREHLAALHREAHAVDGGHRRVALHDVVDDDGGGGGGVVSSHGIDGTRRASAREDGALRSARAPTPRSMRTAT